VSAGFLEFAIAPINGNEWTFNLFYRNTSTTLSFTCKVQNPLIVITGARTEEVYGTTLSVKQLMLDI